jgi:hypothetical protein
MTITNRDKSNLARFGCTFLAKQRTICILWPRERQDQAASADITARLIYTQHASGPLLSLAFEVSPTKILPHYCFFPFDLKNGIHSSYLSDIFKTGQIHLRFLADSRQIARTYEVPPRRCRSLSEMYAIAIADLEKFPAERYDFGFAVSELEQSFRIVDHFAYVFSETALQRLIASSKAQAEKVSPEDRARAAQIASEFLEVFRSRYDRFVREQIQQFPSYSRMLLFLSDLHAAFEGDYNAAAQFATDLISTRTKEENQKLQAWVPFLESVLTLMEHWRETPSGDEQASATREAEFRNIMNRVATQGLSLEALKSIASMLGFQGGRPGRPPKDYSTEYELRAAGKKWREVAEHSLRNDPETGQEFGGRNFAELSRDERSTLMHRVREGLRGFAKRTNRPFPPEKNPNKLLPPLEGEQKNPG